MAITTTTMPTITDLQDQVSVIQKKMESFSKMVDEINSRIKVLTEAENFDTFVQNEIAPYFGESTAENIIKTLQICRREGNNYNHFSPIYQWKGIHGDLKKRQLLKLISAVYRLKNTNKNGNWYGLKSELKYAKSCSECGQLAGAFYDRLVSEGLIK